MQKQAIALICMLVAGSADASHERAIEVAQPIVTEEGIVLSRVTFITRQYPSWGDLVDWTCRENLVNDDTKNPENRNAASMAGIKTWVDPYHFQKQALFGDTVRVCMDLTGLDTASLERVDGDVVSATLECVLFNATQSMTGWSQAGRQEVTAKHLHVDVRGSPEYKQLTQTYLFKDLAGEVPRMTRF